MIGVRISGARHLCRVLGNPFQEVLINFKDSEWEICAAVKTDTFPNTVFLFNSRINSCNHSFDAIVSSLPEKFKKKLFNCKILEINTNNNNWRQYNFFTEIILLPPTFENDYESFLKENSKMMKNVFERYCLSPNDITTKRFYIITDGSKHFFQWAVDLFFKHNCSIQTITNILLWNDCYKQLVKNLSKGTITAYTTMDSINMLLDELSFLRTEKRISDAINSFNTAQKHLLKNNPLSIKDKQTLARFSKLSETKRINFIRKVSTIEDYNELMRQMRHVTSVHFSWSKESFMDFIQNVEGVKYEMVFENDAIVLVKVLDYETVKQLGKTTNWCISKNKTYWNNYIEHYQGKTAQYMIFDFSKLEDDKLSIIGFTTTRNKGITSAHNFTNDNLMQSDNINSTMLKSYLLKFDGKSNIYDILNRCGIDITLVAHYDKPNYHWDYESMMKYLYECVEKDNVTIVKNEDNKKVVLLVNDENIKYFFGDSYIDNIPSDEYYEKHLIFADFTASQYDSNKLQFGIISNASSDEEYCIGLFDENGRNTNTNFDNKLMEFGLPYDIIQRPNDTNKKVLNALMSFNAPILWDCFKDDKNSIHRVMRESVPREEMYHLIIRTITGYLSFDYLNLIYQSGHQLHEYLSPTYLGELLKTIFNEIKHIGRALYPTGVFEKPSEEQIKAFYEEQLQNRNEVLYVGLYLVLKTILSNETKISDFRTAYQKLIGSIANSPFKGELIKEILYLMLEHINMGAKNEMTSNIVHYFLKSGDDEMKDTVKSLCDKYSWIKSYYDEMMANNVYTYSASRRSSHIIVDTSILEAVDTYAPSPF